MTSQSTPDVPFEKQVFCNRTLNFRTLKAIGYDMDYTLIQYRPAVWEERTFHYAAEVLARSGWPVEGLEFDFEQVIQGLVIDRQLGNLLKANRFGYVKRAYHGTKPLEYSELRRSYSRTYVDHRDDRFTFLSTLFSLSEASLFAQLVDRFDAGELPRIQGYAELQARVRGAVDTAHMEGKLKAEITDDPERFVIPDPETPRALLDQKLAGKKVLLITNSGWDYTRKIMEFGFDPYLPDGMHWRDVFDLVIVAARKPSFFMNDNAALRIVDDSGILRPINGGLETGNAYFGANANQVEDWLGAEGSEILYVGDHYFGDVHSSKNILRWRTALIVSELVEELEASVAFQDEQGRLATFMKAKEALEQRYGADRLAKSRAIAEQASAEEVQSIKARIQAGRAAISALDEKIGPLAQAASALNNAAWGPLMRAGNDKSYLAHLVERHADIYTSRVSNFMHQTPFKYYRSPRGSLPHDLALKG